MIMYSLFSERRNRKRVRRR